MDAIETILCPVDFTPATGRQLCLADDLARLFGADLVVHHNIAELTPGAGVGWMWAKDHHQPRSEEDVRERISALCREAGRGQDAEISITRGPASAAVRAVSDAVEADLVVLSTHGVSPETHMSVTAQVLEAGGRSILALHDSECEDFGFDLSAGHKQKTIVPTDLTPGAASAVEFAFELARTLPLELHLLHLLERPAKGERHDRAVATCEERLRALVPVDFVSDAHVHVRDGDPAHGIVDAANELGGACIVMGAHTRGPIRRLISHKISRGVLHEAPCPVWYVP